MALVVLTECGSLSKLHLLLLPAHPCTSTLCPTLTYKAPYTFERIMPTTDTSILDTTTYTFLLLRNLTGVVFSRGACL